MLVQPDHSANAYFLRGLLRQGNLHYQLHGPEEWGRVQHAVHALWDIPEAKDCLEKVMNGDKVYTIWPDYKNVSNLTSFPICWRDDYIPMPSKDDLGSHYIAADYISELFEKIPPDEIKNYLRVDKATGKIVLNQIKVNIYVEQKYLNLGLALFLAFAFKTKCCQPPEGLSARERARHLAAEAIRVENLVRKKFLFQPRVTNLDELMREKIGDPDSGGNWSFEANNFDFALTHPVSPFLKAPAQFASVQEFLSHMHLRTGKLQMLRCMQKVNDCPEGNQGVVAFKNLIDGAIAKMWDHPPAQKLLTDLFFGDKMILLVPHKECEKFPGPGTGQTYPVKINGVDSIVVVFTPRMDRQFHWYATDALEKAMTEGNAEQWLTFDDTNRSLSTHTLLPVNRVIWNAYGRGAHAVDFFTHLSSAKRFRDRGEEISGPTLFDDLDAENALRRHLSMPERNVKDISAFIDEKRGLSSSSGPWKMSVNIDNK